jgi:hypothetical protein
LTTAVLPQARSCRTWPALHFNASGSLYIADSNDNRIRLTRPPLINESLTQPVPSESITVPGLLVPVVGSVVAGPDGVGGYNVVLTLDGTTLPAVDVFTDNLVTTPISQTVGGPTSPFTVSVGGSTVYVALSADTIFTGQRICLLSVGGTCLAPDPVDPNSPSATVLGVSICASATLAPTTCVGRAIPL